MADTSGGVRQRRLEYRRRPCAECPWRRDADLSVFTDGDIARLERADGAAGHEAAPGARVIACHRDQDGTPHPRRLCAGWLAVVGRYSIPVRLAVLAGSLPASALIPGAGWPALWPDLSTLKRRRAAQRAPGEGRCDTVAGSCGPAGG